MTVRSHTCTSVRSAQLPAFEAKSLKSHTCASVRIATSLPNWAMSHSTAPLHRFAMDAMATTFEIVIRSGDKVYAKSAAMAAFDEVKRIETELSRFIPSSDVSQINRLRAGQSLRVGIAAFDCLRLAKAVHAETGGAFDVTIGALMACWRTEQPSPDDLSAARARTGMGLLRIDEATHTVGPTVDGLQVDLGSIGKGYAVDKMVELLREWSVTDALVHAGESSVSAMGTWDVALRDPQKQTEVLGHLSLYDRSLSGSGLSLQGQHILDPRTGRPVEGKLATWALAPSAALSDALSTAFMLMSASEIERYCAVNPEVSAAVLPTSPSSRLMRFGAWSSFDTPTGLPS
ncbi:MAG: FAD:protein FMN transferase [Planctomycetes bacterium]|nr:FAD:protein FMN transferase [Planctomycetota bacterium]